MFRDRFTFFLVVGRRENQEKPSLRPRQRDVKHSLRLSEILIEFELLPFLFGHVFLQSLSVFVFSGEVRAALPAPTNQIERM